MKTSLRLATALGFVLFIALVVLVCVISTRDVDPSMARLVHNVVSEGKIAYGSTTPQQLEELLGYCMFKTRVETFDGGYLYLNYPGGVHACFRNSRGSSTLVSLSLGGVYFQIGSLFHQTLGGRYIDIGRKQTTVLSDEEYIKKKADSFTGVKGKSLVKFDLRGHKETLEKVRFDNQTKWPVRDRMPEYFDPAALLESGKNPGLGLRGMHEQRIDGHGVRIAIIDQPLLRNHIEYADKIANYETKGLMLRFFPPQMHGSPVTSIAVGKTCGVAPAATVFYYTVPMWKLDSRPYCDVIDQIIKLNNGLIISERIRVVSISTGMFPQTAYFEQWKETLVRANENGILVVTCDPAFLKYGTLERIPDKDADDPLNYRRGRYSSLQDVLLVPAGGRTTASYEGTEVYTYWTNGGMSWAAPYLAGLAALAYQVNPEIEPDRIVELWLETAVKTDAGPIVNPVGFIEAVKKTSSGN